MFDTGLVVASLHLVALGMGLGGLWSRAYAGNVWWSAAVLLWLITGLWWLASGTRR